MLDSTRDPRPQPDPVRSSGWSAHPVARHQLKELWHGPVAGWWSESRLKRLDPDRRFRAAGRELRARSMVSIRACYRNRVLSPSPTSPALGRTISHRTPWCRDVLEERCYVERGRLPRWARWSVVEDAHLAFTSGVGDDHVVADARPLVQRTHRSGRDVDAAMGSTAQVPAGSEIPLPPSVVDEVSVGGEHHRIVNPQRGVVVRIARRPGRDETIGRVLGEDVKVTGRSRQLRSSRRHSR